MMRHGSNIQLTSRPQKFKQTSLRFIHSMKYWGRLIFATTHCSGIFVFISQFPLIDINLNQYPKQQREHTQIHITSSSLINHSHQVTKAASFRAPSVSLPHKPCSANQPSNSSTTCLNGIAVSCHTLQFDVERVSETVSGTKGWLYATLDQLLTLLYFMVAEYKFTSLQLKGKHNKHYSHPTISILKVRQKQHTDQHQLLHTCLRCTC